jgi:hypothetical protein
LSEIATMHRKVSSLVVMLFGLSLTVVATAESKIAVGKTLNDIFDKLDKWESTVSSLNKKWGLLKRLPMVGPTARETYKKGTGLVVVAAGAADALDWYRQFPPLDPDDEAFDRASAGMPSARANCAADELCSKCAGDPYGRMERTLARMARNRRLYDYYMAWAKKGIATGDAIAGAAGLGALRWAEDKIEIDRTLKTVSAAYDKGYVAGLEKLDAELKDIDRCEADLYQSDDWYQRHGFLFFETIKSIYRNPR